MLSYFSGRLRHHPALHLAVRSLQGQKHEPAVPLREVRGPAERVRQRGKGEKGELTHSFN